VAFTLEQKTAILIEAMKTPKNLEYLASAILLAQSKRDTSLADQEIPEPLPELGFDWYYSD